MYNHPEIGDTVKYSKEFAIRALLSKRQANAKAVIAGTQYLAEGKYVCYFTWANGTEGKALNTNLQLLKVGTIIA